MKRLALFITAVSISTCLNAQTPHDWENPAVLSINKLPYHATLQLPSKEKECKEIVSLDGQWLFHWSRNPEERPTDFYKEDYDISGWGKITVPGNWQTQGYGTPIYSNIGYPFKRNRPSVTSQPCGLICNVRKCHRGDAEKQSYSAFWWRSFGDVSLD